MPRSPRLPASLAVRWTSHRRYPRTPPGTPWLAQPFTPGQWVLALCLGQWLLWSLAFALTYKAPEIDSAEQFVWAFSMQNGYWKHPPLPSWIMHGLLWVFGPSVALPFVATQGAVVLALALTWRLGCEWMSKERSLVAMALTSLVAYHNVGADAFNHNTAMLPFQAATALLFYRATRTADLRLWALAGLAGGLSMLVKYVALFPLAGLLLYFLLDRSLHRPRQWAGLLLALAVCAAVLVPHALWLQRTDLLPFRYAQSVAQALPGGWASVAALWSFVLIQVTRLLPFLLALLFVFGWRRVLPPRAPVTAPVAASGLPRGDRLFLWITALTPLVSPVLFGLVTGTELQSRWGANAFLLTGWLVLATWRRPGDAGTLKRTLGFVAAAHLMLCLGMTLGKTVVADHLQIRTRANFPGALLAEHARSTWETYSDVPLRLVVSDIWLGGNIVANSSQRVAVLIDGRHFKSPWVRDSAIDDCGALVLDDMTQDARGRAEPNPALDALMARASATGVWSLPWANAHGPGPRGPTGQVRWGIIHPTTQGRCGLR